MLVSAKTNLSSLLWLAEWKIPAPFLFWCVCKLARSSKDFWQRLHIEEVFSPWLFMWVLKSRVWEKTSHNLHLWCFFGKKAFHTIYISGVFLFSICGSCLQSEFFLVSSVYRPAYPYCRKIKTQKVFLQYFKLHDVDSKIDQMKICLHCFCGRNDTNDTRYTANSR